MWNSGGKKAKIIKNKKALQEFNYISKLNPERI